MSQNVDVFDVFFGRQHDNAFPYTESLDDDAYRKAHAKYVAEIGGKWGISSIPTKKGFEKWLQQQLVKEEK